MTVITTAIDYERYLDEINSLMESIPGTPAGCELDRLVSLVEEYEAEHELPLWNNDE